MMAVVFDRTLVRILKICGVPAGRKVVQEYGVPDWIKNSR